jgi:fluoride exporter
VSRYLMIALGGALGSLARYGVALWVQQRVGGAFPSGTFLVNVSGCLIMGVVMTLLTEGGAFDPNWRFLVPIGFIGAYTTFSTFEMETFRAVEEGGLLIALSNIVFSVIVGFLALWLGVVATRRLL